VKSAALLISLCALPVALPAHAKDADDLSSWSLEDLCENRDKRKHEEAVFAELERRGTFRPFELELIREGRIDIGASEAALHCSWGEPRRTESRNGVPWQVYYRRREGGPPLRLLLRIDSSLVAEIRPAPSTGDSDQSDISLNRGDITGGPRPSLSEKASNYDITRQNAERDASSAGQSE
jgi:hypothetical protein